MIFSSKCMNTISIGNKVFFLLFMFNWGRFLSENISLILGSENQSWRGSKSAPPNWSHNSCYTVVSSAHLESKKSFIRCPARPTGLSSSLYRLQFEKINCTSSLNSSRTLYLNKNKIKKRRFKNKCDLFLKNVDPIDQ